MSGPKHGVAPIGKAFDAMTPIVDAVNDGAYHLALWYDEEDDATIVEANRRVTRRVAETIGLRPDEHLLDIGCGPGGPAIAIAEETGARVTGIAISAVEVAAARGRAAAGSAADRVEFQQADYMELPFPDGAFDATMVIESYLGAPDRQHAIREMVRVLRPGGRFALCHCTKEVELDEATMERFNISTWASNLPTLAGWSAMAEQAGLVIEETHQFGARVLGQSARYYSAIDEVEQRRIPGVEPAALEQFKSGMAGFFGPPPGTIGYAIIAGRRP